MDTMQDTQIYVRPGDFFEITLPYSEVCMHMRVADTRMTAELTMHIHPMVQLWKDGRHFSGAITTGEAGLYRDEPHGMFYGYGITGIRDLPEMPHECFTCPCCGDVVMGIRPICSDCREADCQPSTGTCGDSGYTNCQRTDEM